MEENSLASCYMYARRDRCKDDAEKFHRVLVLVSVGIAEVAVGVIRLIERVLSPREE